MLVVLKFYMEGMENSEKISVPLLWVLHTSRDDEKEQLWQQIKYV